jgi:GNAT superfamily N-acetyltransferase
MILGTYCPKSGEEITLRLIKKEDAPLLVDLFHHLSFETKRLRFHLFTEKLPEDRIWQEALALADLDPQRQVAIMASIIEADGQEHAVGVARFARASVEDTEAEVAVVVRDDFQRKGVARCLLNYLAEKARELGLTHFSGWVMAENIRLMKLIKSLEVPIETEVRYGYRKVRAPLNVETK